jgi:hypothetical protein
MKIKRNEKQQIGFSGLRRTQKALTTFIGMGESPQQSLQNQHQQSL